MIIRGGFNVYPREIEEVLYEHPKRVVDDLAPQGEADFVPECAALLPMHNICDMMGVPEDVRRKVADEARYAGGWSDPELMGDQPPLPRLWEAMGYLREVARDLIGKRRNHPEHDLLTNLVEADVDGEKLTDDEIVSFFGLLTIAGNDTTRQSSSHAMKALTDFPDQRAWLMEDFDARIKSAVEEFVRWATPIMTFRRTATRDCELAGQQITQGDKVVMFYASANWDTDVFTEPERFDLSRHPNPHVGFGGGGIHHCLGGQLARQQLAALFDELLHRLPDIEVCGEPSYTVNTFFHGVNHLPVRFTPSHRQEKVMKIVHNETRCSSIGMCEAVAPEFFEVGDDGALRVLNSAPADCHRALIEEAVADCPTGALSIEG